MSTEILAQLLSVVKDTWNFLYGMATKQVTVEFYCSIFWFMFSFTYIVWLIITSIKYVKYTQIYYSDREPKNTFYEWIEDHVDSGFFMPVSIVTAAILILFGCCINNIILYLINPEYLIYLKIIEMLPEISG